MGFLLWILAIICIVFGVVNLIQGAILWGVVLIVVGCLLGGWGPFVGGRY
jgi:hypothetical protein